jgi:hypothetical protein
MDLDVLELKIEAARKRLAALENMRDALADDTLAQDLQDVFGSLTPKQPPALPPVRRAPPPKRYPVRATRETVVERMRDYMRTNGNKPVTIEEMISALGCSSGAIRQVLYRANPEEFERHSQQGGGRPTTFWLKSLPKGGGHAAND